MFDKPTQIVTQIPYIWLAFLTKVCYNITVINKFVNIYNKC